jgi:MFS transporter, CP family, cyanate transporter
LTGPRRRHLWWLGAVVLVALNLRPAIASVPPLADTISADLGLSAAATGVLTTLPLVCMGLFAPLGPSAARRFGTDRVLAAALVLTAVGTALRAVAQPGVLYAATTLVGIGIAVGGALLPSLVRARFPDRIGPVTGLYTAGLIGGALLAAALTAQLPFHWPWQLAFWTIPAVIALVAWLAVDTTGPPDAVPAPVAAPSADEGEVLPPWRSGRAWVAAFFMGGQSLLYYGPFAWYAARYTSIGVSTSRAGLLLGLVSATQLISSLGVPLLAHRSGKPRPWIAASVGLTGVCLALVALAPRAAPEVWASLLGLGIGGQFVLALTVLSTFGATARESAAVTGMALFVGYLLAAVGPVVAGAMRDATGGYTWPFAVFAVFSIPVLLAGLRAAAG